MNQYIIPILQQWKEEAGVNEPILFRFSLIDNAITIFTNKPGYLIGKAGYLFNKFLEQFKQELRFNDKFKIYFKEVDGCVENNMRNCTEECSSSESRRLMNMIKELRKQAKESKEEDNECIKRLAEIIWELSQYGGNEEQINYLEEELKKRNINPDEIFTY